MEESRNPCEGQNDDGKRVQQKRSLVAATWLPMVPRSIAMSMRQCKLPKIATVTSNVFDPLYDSLVRVSLWVLASADQRVQC